MSVQTNNYLIWGIKFPYKTIHKTLSNGNKTFDIIEPYMDSPYEQDQNKLDNITVISDGMCSEYVIIGHVFTKSDVYEGFEKPIEIIDLTVDQQNEITGSINKLLHKIEIEHCDNKPNWHVLTHCR